MTATFLGLPAGSGNLHSGTPFPEAARTALGDTQQRRCPTGRSCARPAGL